MVRPPVRLSALISACLVLFTFSYSWGRAAGRPAAGEGPALPTLPAAAAAPQPTRVLGPGVSRSGPTGARAPAAAPEPRGPAHTEVRRHVVTQGDTLWELSVRYGTSLEALLAANPRIDAGHLQIGQELVLPAGGSARAGTVAQSNRDLSLGGLFIWPVIAPVSSTFGPRWGRNHAGIDLAANQGEPILAAREGEVLLAGTVEGYGETVVLQHKDGTRTLYAHASRLLVKTGQSVPQGQVIALVGSTGRSTGPHLHFEIIVDDRPRDPLEFLPPR